MEIDHSAIARIARCPRAYELDLQGVPSPKSAALYLGATFHLVQKVYFNSRLAGVELSVSDVVDVFNNFWNSGEGADGQGVYWDRDRPAAQAELGRAMVSAFYPYAQKIQPLLVEHKFTRDTPYGTVYGTIDLITTSGVINDWKTSKWLPYQDALDSSLQPTIYNFLLSGLVPFYYYYIIKFRFPIVRVYLTKRREEDLMFFERSLLPSVVKILQTGIFPPFGAVTGACRWCPYKGICRSI